MANIMRKIYDGKIIKFNDFDQFEYRRGSSKFGGLLTKIMEYLRLFDNDSKTLKFDIKNFESETNIELKDVEELIKANNETKTLFDFNIEIQNDEIIFSNLNNKQDPFESKI
jgi:hypothetical protein